MCWLLSVDHDKGIVAIDTLQEAEQFGDNEDISNKASFIVDRLERAWKQLKTSSSYYFTFTFIILLHFHRNWHGTPTTSPRGEKEPAHISEPFPINMVLALVSFLKAPCLPILFVKTGVWENINIFPGYVSWWNLNFALLVCHSGWESEELRKKHVQRDWNEKLEIPDDFFEGAEKLLEIFWAPGSGGGDLGCLSRKMIEEILQLARYNHILLPFYSNPCF